MNTDTAAEALATRIDHTVTCCHHLIAGIVEAFAAEGREISDQDAIGLAADNAGILCYCDY